MKLVVVYFIVASVLIGCASQKRVQNPSPKTTYTIDDSIKDQKTAPPIDSTTNEIKIHVVMKGESLSVIAIKYGVSVDDIIKANNIKNPNFIQINQKLIIPEGKKK